MPGKAFLDTNILVYAFRTDDQTRRATARSLLAQGGLVGVQTLNEFVNVARRKLGLNWEEIHAALKSIHFLCPEPPPLTFKIHSAAVAISSRYGYRIHDSLIIAAAMEADCPTLYSEDMQDGQEIGGVTIRNPFREPQAAAH